MICEKRIAFYINSIHEGGAERVLLNIAEQFNNHGYRVVIITSFIDKWEYEIPQGIKRISIETYDTKQNRIKKNLFRIRRLREICKEETPSCLISFMAEANFRAILATVGMPIKTVISVRNDPNIEYNGRIAKIMAKILLPYADWCVFQTGDAKQWFPKKLQKKSSIIANPVKKDFFNIKRQPIEGEIVSIGRLEEQKNHTLLISAFMEVHKICPNIRLKIYGTGTLKDKIEKYINMLGLTNVVTLMGATKDVPDVLSKAELFVLSSDYEGMPNALMEALAAGVPSIATDCPCGGSRELIINNKNGILVPVSNIQELKNAMLEILTNKELRNKISKNAKLDARKFSSEKIFREWEKNITYLL